MKVRICQVADPEKVRNIICVKKPNFMYVQWRIQDFPEGSPTPKVGVQTYYFAILFAENCMKIKEFGPPVGTSVPGTPLESANACLCPCPYSAS